jgi:hypothetical protein
MSYDICRGCKRPTFRCACPKSSTRPTIPCGREWDSIPQADYSVYCTEKSLCPNCLALRALMAATKPAEKESK